LRNDRFWLGCNLRLVAFSQTLPAFSMSHISARAHRAFRASAMQTWREVVAAA
jgi:hypothetical protein